jgi:hypothetical protein
MSEETPPSYNTSVFNQANFNEFTSLDTEYLNANYVKYPVTQTGLITIANLATTNDATIDGLTVGKGNSSSASANTAFGVSALLSSILPIANNNTAIGYQALTANIAGARNTAVGSGSLASQTVGNNNTAVGYLALNINTGNDNTSIGGAALQSNTTGSTNTAVGYGSLASNNTGGNNTAVGYQAGQAGTANTTGSNNTYVGYNSQANANNYSNSTALGSGAIITASYQVVLGTSADKVIIPNQINFNYISNPTLVAGSIGYTYSSSISSITILNNNEGLLSTISSVPIGVYLVQYLTTYYDVVGTATNTRIKTYAGITSFGKEIASNNVLYFTANDYISATLSVVYTNTAVSNFQLNAALNGSSTSIKSYISEGGYFRATRIA